jgi:hypothetical protein
MCPAAKEAAVRFRGAPTPLFEKERDVVCRADVAQLHNPARIDRSMPRPRFAAGDKPVDAAQVEVLERTQ